MPKSVMVRFVRTADVGDLTLSVGGWYEADVCRCGSDDRFGLEADI